MNEATVTVLGFVAAEPRYFTTDSGTSLMTLRIGSTPRRYDRESGQWKDDETMFLTVNAWRGLADNLNGSDLKRGDPLIVTGRLRIRDYEKDGQRRYAAVVEAVTVGHDLSRGSARFRRALRGAAAMEADRQQADDLNDVFLTEEQRQADDGTAPDEAKGTDEVADSEADDEVIRVPAAA